MLKFKIKMIVKENAKNKEPYPIKIIRNGITNVFLRKKNEGLRVNY